MITIYIVFFLIKISFIMKSTIKLILTFIFFHSLSQIGAQIDKDLIWNDNNQANEVTGSAFILTTSYKLQYLKFKNRSSFNDLRISSKAGTRAVYFILSDSEILIKINDERQDYEVNIEDSKGKSINLFTIINTKDLLDGTISNPDNTNSPYVAFQISEELNKILIRYSSGEITMTNLLLNDASVSVYEKINFYQRHILRNVRYATAAIDVYGVLSQQSIRNNDRDILDKFIGPNVVGPDGPEGDEDDEEEDEKEKDCKCSELIIYPEHNPQGVISNNSGFDQNVDYTWMNNDGPGLNKTPLGNGGDTWRYHKAKGASKWHALYTDGWKEQSGSYQSISQNIGSNGTTQKGIIRVHLVCTNSDEYAEDCMCEKEVVFNYNYETCAGAHSHNLNSSGSKRSDSKAQDMALAFCYTTDDKGSDVSNIQPIRGIDVGASAQCESNTNPAYQEAWKNLGLSLLGLIGDDEGDIYEWVYTYQYDSTLIKIDTLQTFPPIPPDTVYTYLLDSMYRIDTIVIDSTQELVVNLNTGTFTPIYNSLFDVITTSRYLPVECDESKNCDGFKGNFITTLKPNEVLTFGVFSNHELQSGGMRSWYSEAHVVSSYGMSVVVKSGSTSGDEVDCCTPITGAYLVGAGLLGSDNLNDYKSRVGADLYINGGFATKWPNGLSGSGFNKRVRGDAGIMHRNPDHISCPVPINPRSKKPLSGFNDFPSTGTISIFSTDGKLIADYKYYNGEQKTSLNDIKTFVNGLPSFGSAGLYLITYKAENFIKTYKHILSN